MNYPSMDKYNQVLTTQGLGSMRNEKTENFGQDTTGKLSQVTRVQEEINGLLNGIDLQKQQLVGLAKKLEPVVNHGLLTQDKESEPIRDEKVQSKLVQELSQINTQLRFNTKIITELLRGLEI